MAYEKQNWQSNELLTSEKLNHMEDGIATANTIVTQSTAGLMAAEDKIKLDGIAASAVTSVNNQTGAVSITPANIGAKAVQSAVSNPTASGTAVAFIDSISQNAQGVISPTKKTVQSASQSAAGLMSAADKTKLDGIAPGAQVNPGNATTSSAGLMSSTDKTKLDGIAERATANVGTVTSVATGTGLKGGPITGSGTISTNVPRVAKDSKSLPGANTWILEEYTSGSNYNLPSNHWYYIFSMQGSDAKYGAQLALGMSTSGAYYRECNNQTWGAWKSLINTNAVTSVNNQTGAVSITPANIGAVAKSGDTMTGPLRLDNTDLGSRAIHFDVNGSEVGWFSIDDSGYSQNVFQFIQRNPNVPGAFGLYQFPAADDNPYGFYEILTTKSAVTIPQGGTGANSATEARHNFFPDDLSNESVAYMAGFTTGWVKGGWLQLPLPLPYGGTGATTAAGARANLGTSLYISSGSNAKATVYSQLNALNTSEAIAAMLSADAASYLSGNKVTNAVDGVIRKASATSYVFAMFDGYGYAYRWQATVTASGATVGNCYKFTGTKMT